MDGLRLLLLCSPELWEVVFGTKVLGNCHDIYEETSKWCSFGRGLWFYMAKSSPAPPVVFSVVESNYTKFNDLMNRDIPFTWEAQMLLTSFTYKNNFEDFKHQVKLMSIQCREVYYLMHVTVETFVNILEQLKQDRMANSKFKWIFRVVDANDEAATLRSKLPVGHQVRLIIEKREGRVSLSNLAMYKETNTNGRIRKSRIGEIASWQANATGYDQITIHPMPRTMNLRGQSLTAAAVDDFPFFSITREGDASGIDVSIANALAKVFNFTYVAESPADLSWGGLQPDGTITGMIGMVARDEADFAINELTITAERNVVVEFSFPYYYEPTVVLSPAPKQSGKEWAVFTPIRIQVWIVLALTVPFYGFCLWFVQRFLCFKQEDGKVLTLMKFLYYVFQSSFGHPLTRIIKSFPLRIILVTFYMVNFIFRALYGGTLIAALISPNYEKPIDSVDDLAKATSITTVTTPGTSIYSILESATSGPLKEIFDNIKAHEKETLIPSYDGIFDKIEDGKHATLLAQTPGETRAIVRGRQRFHIGRARFYPQCYGVALPRGSPLVDAFTRPLLWIRESGLIDKWKTDQEVKAVSSNRRKNSETENSSHLQRFTMTHLQGAFILYVMGLTASLLSGIVELIISKWHFIK